MKTSIIPVFIPHLGCPHLCTFCNQKKISGALTVPEREDILSLAEQYFNADISKVYEIAFFGGSFTALEYEKQKYYLETAAELKKAGKIKRIRFSTRPDCINSSILDLAERYKVDIIELGLQSMDDKVLEMAERGHKAADTTNAAEMIKDRGFTLGLQIMPGLMGDSEESILETVRKSILMRPDFVRIYPTVVIKGTKLEEYYEEKKYVPFSLEKMTELVAAAYQLYMDNGIKIIRMGLQYSENLTSENDLVAGPYHPAFGELVFSRIYKEKILSKIKDYKFKGKNKVTVRINPNEISKGRGHKNQNIIEIKNEFNIDLIFIADKTVMKGEIETEV